MRNTIGHILALACSLCCFALPGAGQSADVPQPASWLYPHGNGAPHLVPARDRLTTHNATIPSAAPTVMWGRTSQGTKASLPNRKNLVILVNFSDVKFFNNQESIDKLLNSDNYVSVADADASGSVKKYLYDQLGETFEFDVVGFAELDRQEIYYGAHTATANDCRPGEMVAKACIYAHDHLGVNFSDYSSDGKVVDNICIFFAGQDEAQQSGGKHPEYIWSHSWNLSYSDYGKSLTLDGVVVDRYICTSELYLKGQSDSGDTMLATIGTFCHEFSHHLGLLDLYDVNYELDDGLAMGMWWYTAVMDGGNYNNYGHTPPSYNAIDRMLLSRRKFPELTPGEYTMYPWGNKSATAYCITNPRDVNEFYVLECRDAKSSSYVWDKYIGGSGLLLYHIDKSDKYPQYSENRQGNYNGAARWSINEINSRPCVLEGKEKVVSTKGHQCADLIEADLRKDFFPNRESAVIGDIQGIFFPNTNAYSIGGKSNVKLTFWDGTQSEINITSIKFRDGVATFKVSDSPLPPEPVNPPTEEDPLYIIVLYSKAPVRGVVEAGTSLYLKASNEYKSTVAWYFNNAPIEDPTRFVPSTSGEIRSEITREDGTVDYLFKSIVVR